MECPYDLKEGVWPDMASSSAMEGVLGSGGAKYFSADVGTVMNVRVGTHVYDVKVVGIVKQVRSSGGDLKLSGITRDILDIADLLGIKDIIPTFRTDHDAAASF